jgi:hypothetical protein
VAPIGLQKVPIPVWDRAMGGAGLAGADKGSPGSGAKKPGLRFAPAPATPGATSELLHLPASRQGSARRVGEGA